MSVTTGEPPKQVQRKRDQEDTAILGVALVGLGGGLWWLLRNKGAPPVFPVPSPTPGPTPGDPWLEWWNRHPAGTGYREAVSLFYVLLGIPPALDSEQPYPVGVYLNTTFCAGTALQTTGYRLVSDSHCGFFNRVNSLAGGPGGYPQSANQCSECDAPSCVFTGVCSDTGQPGQGANRWMTAAAQIVLGRSALVPYAWVPGVNCSCGPTSAWVNAVQKDLIDTPEFTQRINEMAAAPAPPWEPGGHPGPA